MTTTPPVLLYRRLVASMMLQVARLLDEIVQGAGVDSTSPWEAERHAVQRAEALWAAPGLLAAIAAADTTADLAALAAEADDTCRACQDDGRGWQAEVWAAVAAQLWRYA